MHSSRTKQINVYGKRSKRVIDAPLTENSTTDNVAVNPGRTPLIYRMKKRENGSSGTKLAVKSKPRSPHRMLSTMKQRVGFPRSPIGKNVKPGARVAEILAEQSNKYAGSCSGQWCDYPGRKGVPGTPSRMPLSTIATNRTNSPTVSSANVMVKVPKKKKGGSPSRLGTSKAPSTVQMDITVLDSKGQTVKQEKRITRTDVVVNPRSEVQPAVHKRRSSSHQVVTPTEVISISSSASRFSRPSEIHDPSDPIVLSSGSSVANDSDALSLEILPNRKPRRALQRVIISDDEDELSEENDHEDTYVLPGHMPSRTLSRDIISDDEDEIKYEGSDHDDTLIPPDFPPRPSMPQVAAVAPVLRKTSKPNVEVIVPLPSYKIQHKPLPRLSSILQDTQAQTKTIGKELYQHSSKQLTNSWKNTILGTTTQEPAPSRYPFTTSYSLISSPPLKVHQLTPIRRGQIRGSAATRGLFAYGRGVPLSPTTPTNTDFDLSLELSQFDIGIAPEELDTLRRQGLESKPVFPDYLTPLLEECRQEECGPYEFSAFIESFPFDPILQNSRQPLEGRRHSNETLAFRKIGEASYSEVFGIGDVVLKVIPLRDESRCGGGEKEEEADDGPAPTDARDVRKEIIVTRAMGEVHEGFVKLLKAYVVRGKYPEVLLSLWDEYNEKKGSESVRPDTFTLSQTYAIIVLPNDGPDLEAYTFSNASKMGWRKASSLFWQVAKALAHAEELVSFEHRDLHWGQILVKEVLPSRRPTPLGSLTHTLNQSQVKGARKSLSTKAERVFMDDLDHGVQATIIDLGLSRMDAGDGSDEGEKVHWTPFDEEVFMGGGDYQFDVYRLMKEYTRENWKAYHPLTNVMWLHYLVSKLLRYKNLKAPLSAQRKPRLTSNNNNGTPIDPRLILQNIKPSFVNPPSPHRTSGPFTEKECYDALVDVEQWLGRCIAEVVPAVQKPKGRGRSNKASSINAAAAIGSSGGSVMCSSAGEVVKYGVKRSWIRPISLS